MGSTRYEIYEKARDAKGLTNYQVARLTGISQSTLSDWKHGIYQPKLDKLIALSKFLELPVDALLEVE